MSLDDNDMPRLSIVRSATTHANTTTTVADVEAAIAGDLTDEATLALRLGVSRATLQSWRYAGRGPSYIKIGRLIRYREADVERFLVENTRRTRDSRGHRRATSCGL